jgi:predicted MarR family transcription regulator
MRNLIDRPASKRLAAEASMSDDPDLLKANYALQVLRQARLSRNETAARMVEHLTYVTTNTGLRTSEIEETQQATWVAISELAKALNEEGFAGPTLWKAALRATESWKKLLI